jgi:hypothetical protein
LRRRVVASGLPVALRVLRESDPAADLQDLVAVGPGRTGMVLTDPRSLHGALRDLTLRVMVAPPCTLYMTDRTLYKTNRPAERAGRRLFTRLLRQIWQCHAPQER